MSHPKSTVIYSHASPRLLSVSLTIRCCKIDGHREIDLCPRRGMKRTTWKKASTETSQQKQHAKPHQIPELTHTVTHMHTQYVWIQEDTENAKENTVIISYANMKYKRINISCLDFFNLCRDKTCSCSVV